MCTSFESVMIKFKNVVTLYPTYFVEAIKHHSKIFTVWEFHVASRNLGLLRKKNNNK